VRPRGQHVPELVVVILVVKLTVSIGQIDGLVVGWNNLKIHVALFAGIAAAKSVSVGRCPLSLGVTRSENSLPADSCDVNFFRRASEDRVAGA